MTDIENQANQKQNTICATGTPTNTQNNKSPEVKKANKCCLGKPAIIAIVVIVVLLAILIPVILFTVVLKDDENGDEAVKKELDEAEQKCIEKNTKEVDMMRRFAQINTDEDLNLSAAEHFQAFKDLSAQFTEEAFQQQIDHFDQNYDGLQSYDEYVAYSQYLTKMACELSSDWLFVEPVVKPDIDQEEKIKECVQQYMPSFAEIDQYFYMADLSDDQYLDIDEMYQLYNQDGEEVSREILQQSIEAHDEDGNSVLDINEFIDMQYSYWWHNCMEILGIEDEDNFAFAGENELKPTFYHNF